MARLENVCLAIFEQLLVHLQKNVFILSLWGIVCRWVREKNQAVTQQIVEQVNVYQYFLKTLSIEGILHSTLLGQDF
jgi:hypothetical protein